MKASLTILNILIVGSLSAILATTSTCAQTAKRFRVAAYNVENLFDTIPSFQRADNDFTPNGDYAWNSQKYWSKLGKLSRVIAALGGESPAALIALCEVENTQVIDDLTLRTRLRRLGYEGIVANGSDPRGVNVGLLYQPLLFAPVFKREVSVMPPTKQIKPTRNILHVGGRIPTGDTLDVFVVHMPSQNGGRDAKRYRGKIADRLRQETDLLHFVRQKPYIIILGDFNEDIADSKLLSKLQKGKHDYPNVRMHLMESKSDNIEIEGSYFFQREWNKLDHILVNETLLSNYSALHTSLENCHIVTFPFLLEQNTAGRLHPRRTFLGTHYHGGVSDHLPVYTDLFY